MNARRSTSKAVRTMPPRGARRAGGASEAVAFRVEPVEVERAENAALDRIERDVELVLAGGGEAALAARLRRILPKFFEGD